MLEGIVTVKVEFSFTIDKDDEFTDEEDVKSYAIGAALEVMSDAFITDMAEITFEADENKE